VFVNGAPAGEAGGAPIPLPAGVPSVVVALKIDPAGAKAVRLPEAAVEAADPGARTCAASLEMFEQIFPDLKGDLQRRKGAAVAALASGGAPAFLAALNDMAALIQERSKGIKDYTAWFVGQSHIDMVWLWRWEESIQIFKDTFGQAIRFIEEHPRYTYAQSQAAAYLATEQHHPELFAKIRKAVQDGRWSVVGGMWVEPDLNMPSGEATVRQLLYGKRYFLEKLGVDVKVGWNPDTFGHNAQLPQILKKSGVDYYVFWRCGKDRRLFWWEAPDGSRVLCQATTVPATPGVVKVLKAAEQETGVKAVMNMYGAGDHGGGPTRDDLARIDRLRETALFPTVDYGLPEKVFPLLEKGASSIPVVKEEMNFICEGCYTTHGRVKRANRWSENLLGSAETAAAIAHDFGLPADRKAFEQNWRMVLFNQFHDLLPGSGFPDIYRDAERDYAEVFRTGEQARRAALDAVAAQVKTEGAGIPVFVFNPLGWTRTDAVEADVPYQGSLDGAAVFDEAGNEVPSQVAPGSGGYRPVRMLFLARDVPSAGHRVYWVRDAGAGKAKFDAVAATKEKVESDRFILEVDPASGCFTRLFDKAAAREVLGASPPLVPAAGPASGKPADAPQGQPLGGNLLQLLGDRGAMSAWYITYTGEQWALDRGAKAQVVERGPVRAVLRITRTFKDDRPGHSFGPLSVFQQDVAVYHGVGRIDLMHEIDWHERYKMLKLAFPAAVQAPAATAEIAYGTVARPTAGADHPMLNWVDLSDGKHGLGILNNGRHGYDVTGSVMRIHLLRSSFDPDPEPDRGHHRFVLSLVPHAGDWRAAGMAKRGAELNLPMTAWAVKPHGGTLPPSASFAAVEPANVMLGALKRAEDTDAVVVRVVETDGAAGTTARVRLWKPPASAVEADLLERDVKPIPIAGEWLEFPIGGYEIKTLKITFK
jgi:alpha-mannosidase